MLSYISSLLVIMLLLLAPTAAFANGSFTGLETSFSSPEGIAALIPSSYLLYGPTYPVAHKEIKNQLGPSGVNKTLDGSTDHK